MKTIKTHTYSPYYNYHLTSKHGKTERTYLNAKKQRTEYGITASIYPYRAKAEHELGRRAVRMSNIFNTRNNKRFWLFGLLAQSVADYRPYAYPLESKTRAKTIERQHNK